MTYSRTQPSPRYLALQSMYRAMHENGETFLGIPPQETFPGASLPPQAARIKRLISLTGANTILDYGSGKGQQYEPGLFRDDQGGQWPGIIDYWDIDEIVCYDPCYPPFSALPSGTFDGVVSTDVLEHCPEDDIPWIIEEIFGYASRFVFANVACYPARKRLPSGENAHCTIKPVDWWAGITEGIAARHPGIAWEMWIQSRADSAGRAVLTETRIGNG